MTEPEEADAAVGSGAQIAELIYLYLVLLKLYRVVLPPFPYMISC